MVSPSINAVCYYEIDIGLGRTQVSSNHEDVSLRLMIEKVQWP